jgi:para-nitrobenzyl esterase
MRNKTKILVFCSFAVVLFFSLLAFNSKNVFESVKVEGGLISGTTDSSGNVHIFEGIPFAAPPVGELRWKAPQPVVPWQGVKKCDAFGPSPMQGNPVPFGPWSEEYLIPKEPISEDCLYLNVSTAAKSQDEKRPVLVWIYGGGFVSGGSGVPIYDGEAMAKKGIVFVSINYRVGIFGFFALPELTEESKQHSSGNYGILDQIAALHWVQKNISAFGGDPANVTIAGQSAGSMSVNCLVASPLCKGLFKRAIGESGASFIEGARHSPTLAEAENEGVQLEKKININSLEELRNISAQQLLSLSWRMNSPKVDGYLLPESIPTIFEEDKQNQVDLLTGWNEDDGVIFGKPSNVDAFKKEIELQYGKNAKRILKYYPAQNDEQAANSQKRITRDVQFGIQNYTWASEHARESSHPVFLYRFIRKLPATGEYVKYGAFHTGEVAYAYGNLRFVNRCPWQPVDFELEKTMLSYWSNFVKNGNPNGDGIPEWPAFNNKTNEVMFLGENPVAKSLPDKKSLDELINVLGK